MANDAPFKVGDRVAFMPNGHTLAAGIILRVEQGSSGSWRGDIRSRYGDLVNRSLHPDLVVNGYHLLKVTQLSWAPVWEELESPDWVVPTTEPTK